MVEEYLVQKGWNYRPQGQNDYVVKECPFCEKNDWRFTINQESGIFTCHGDSCEKGTFKSLKFLLGDYERESTNFRKVYVRPPEQAFKTSDKFYSSYEEQRSVPEWVLKNYKVENATRYIAKDNAEEMYAKGIGMVWKEVEMYKGSFINGAEDIDNGFKVTYTYLKHGK